MGNKNLKINIIKILFFSILVFSFGIFGFSNAATYVSDSQKQIIRDTKRLNDLTIFKKAIEDYKSKNGFYPKLETGTNIKGYVNSAWSSQWTSFCGLIGLSSCPVDPLNKILNCDCSIFSLTGECSDNNINSNIDKTTCYNLKDQKFACTAGSNIYQYKSLNNGRNYEFSMEFEYRKDGDYTAGADYWNVNNYDNGNHITIDNNCSGVPAKIFSNTLGKCGDFVIQSGEQCDGNDKIEFCTNLQGEIGKMLIKCNSCKYEVKNTKLTSECKMTNFCGDGIVQTDKGEECDGGHEKMCFTSIGQHDWYGEKIRYCQNNCKWNNTDAYKNSLTSDLCGGYCGDGKIQSNEECDFGVEYLFWDTSLNLFKKCSDYNSVDSCPTDKCSWNFGNCNKKNIGGTLKEKHCYIRNVASCKYINNIPTIPTIKNSNFSALSYVKDGASFAENTSSINETNLFVKKISRNSVFLEFSLDGVAVGSDNVSDVDGDEIMYKFEFVNKANNSIGFYKSNNIIGNNSILSTTRGEEITGKWVKHSELAKVDQSTGKVTSKIFFRIYTNSLSANTEDAKKGIIKLLDGSYFGDYKFRISVKDSWTEGPNVEGNMQNVENSKDISFYIGTSCGDHVLQAINDEGQHEYCEWKPGYDKFSNWSVNEPSGNGNCATIKTGAGWNAKWDDVSCSDSYYGICKKALVSSCPTGWISVDFSDGKKDCYGLTTKTTYDAASTECYFNYDKAYLVNISSPAENNLINDLIKGTNPTNKFIYSGDPVFWIGFYNIKKLRTPEQNNFPTDTNPLSLWASSLENGNPDVYSISVYNGGSGKSFSSQYLCSNTCNDIGGYCGDGILENGAQDLTNPSFYTVQKNSDSSTVRTFYIGNFEQCDPTAQGKGLNYTGQSGVGSGWYLQSDGTKMPDSYGCQACSSVGGFCGSGTINNAHFNKDGYISSSDPLNQAGIDYEHCDPGYVLRPSESGNNSKDRGAKPNYICALNGSDYLNLNSLDNKNNLYKIPNPKSETRMVYFPYDDITSNGGIAGNKMTLDAFIKQQNAAKSFGVNTNGACQNSTGGYCGDGNIQMAYIAYQLSQNVDEKYAGNSSYYKDSYVSDDLIYNDKDIELGKVLDLKRKIIIGTSNYRNNIINNNIVTTSNKSATYNYGKNNNDTYVGDVDSVGKFNNLDFNSYRYWLEKCDPSYFPKPYETNNLVSGSFYKKFDKDLVSLEVNDFSGFPTLRYSCNGTCGFNSYKIKTNDLKGTSVPIEIASDDYNLGYCGDGIVTGYGTNDLVSTFNSFGKITSSLKEQCDPKNHIVGPNGSNSEFGDNNINGCKRNTQINYYNSEFVFGKDCSSFVTPATSDSDSTYSCNYDCLAADNSKGGGYCGDGVVQDKFFEECDYGDSKYNTIGLLNNLSTANSKTNYICGIKDGYNNYSFDVEYQNNDNLKTSFNSSSFKDDNKNQNGKIASCMSFGGYCGDGQVQSCKIGENLYGASSNYNSCYNLVASADEYTYLDSNGVTKTYKEVSFNLKSGATLIENCDSAQTACFVINSGIPSPLLYSSDSEFFDFKKGEAGEKTYYAEINSYSVNGAGSSGSSGPYGTAGKCGTSNAKTNISISTDLNDLCDVGIASTVRFDNSNKKYTWTCNGFDGGAMVSCYADAQITASPVPGKCGSDNNIVCNKPACTDGGKKVFEGDKCDAGVDCKEKDFGNNIKINICSVECFYKDKSVTSGEACDFGRTCVGGIKQKLSSMDAFKNKCETGFAGDVSNNGTTWSWTCKGIYGSTTNANCTASSSLSIDGVCGTNFGTCDIGISSKPKFNSSNNVWEWTCGGFNGGDFGKCSSVASGSEKQPPVCGSANNQNFISLYALMNDTSGIYSPSKLCSKGVAGLVNLNSSTGKYVWKCSYNGVNQDCSANYITTPTKNGICANVSVFKSNTKQVLCIDGYPENITYIPAFSEVRWDCKGVGVNVSEPVKDSKCFASVESIGIKGVCGSPINMFQASSGAQYPSSSTELKNAGMFTNVSGILGFKLCKSGYPTHLSSGQSWADKIMKFGETKGNRCDYTGNSYLSSDCMNLQLKLPFIGKVDLFHMTMPWQWTCNGVNGGSSNQCFVFNPSMFFKQNGECGSDANKSFPDAALVMDRCKAGYATNVDINSSNQITWTCKGFNYGSDASCVANLKSVPVINGVCGSSNNASGLWNYSNISSPCSSGIFSKLKLVRNSINETMQWYWDCDGISGGKTVSCSSDSNWKNNNIPVKKIDGKCKNLTSGVYKSTSDIMTAGACNYGYVSNLRYEISSKKFKWNCIGSDDGSTELCEVLAGSF